MFFIHEVEEPNVEVQFTYKIKVREETDVFYFGMQIPFSGKDAHVQSISHGPDVQIIGNLQCGNNSFFCFKFLFEEPVPINEIINMTIKNKTLLFSIYLSSLFNS